MARKTTDRLKLYNSKRDFTKSPEPSGKKATKKKAKTLIFCVQKHLASHLHYDFRLEFNGALLSWAVPKGPSRRPGEKRLAMHVEDHPLDYADFEGVIPEGYGAGIVMVWDRGTWEPEAESSNIEEALAKGQLKFRLEGVKLKGSWALVRMARDPRSWLLLKHRDDWAGDIDITTFAPKSVKSGGDFEDILSGKEPAIWKSHRPAEGGAAGKLLKEIIERAAKLKMKKSPKSKVQRPKSLSR